ncbi:MAG TPA: hypothetical protein VGG24_16570 [Paraburkholderia sp.]
MGTKIQSSSAAAFAVVLAASFQPGLAQADGPQSAYENGGRDADASLDPGEEQMTADDENKARMQDLSDAYHNGYNARAKEDAETYASLRNQLKSTQNSPPLPQNMPDGDDARVSPVQQAPVAQTALPAQQPYPYGQQPMQQPMQQMPQPVQQYATAPAYQYQAPPPVYQQPMVMQQSYAPPPPQPVAQYAPVYAQTQYVPPPQYAPPPPPQPVYQQPPVVQVAAPAQWPAYQQPGYYGYGYPRAYGYQVWR